MGKTDNMSAKIGPGTDFPAHRSLWTICRFSDTIPLDMELVDTPVALQELQQLAADSFGGLVKAVVDVMRGILVINGDLHADEERMLLENASSQENLWGINLYPDRFPEPQWVEFDSMINIRPRQNNRTRGVEDPAIRSKIIEIVERLVKQ